MNPTNTNRTCSIYVGRIHDGNIDFFIRFIEATHPTPAVYSTYYTRERRHTFFGGHDWVGPHSISRGLTGDEISGIQSMLSEAIATKKPLLIA